MFRICIIASGLALVAASAHEAGTQTPGTLRGRVTGPTGDALAGASITATGTPRVATSRADGSYQLRLPAGRYELRVRLLGYTKSGSSTAS